MRTYIDAIGKIEVINDDIIIALDPPYRDGLKGLEGFSHTNVLWWCNGCDDPLSRQKMMTSAPYSEEALGVFATRTPQRPNPIALTIVEIIDIDLDKGILIISWIDANNGSPVIDLKPYTPSLDRVENPVTPSYLSHWPKSLEASSNFDWSSVF
ncbi:MAG: SAM-dependent methyltransferase [Acinetobacter sp.]